MTGKDIPGHIEALTKSCKEIDFGKVLLLSPDKGGLMWNQGDRPSQFIHCQKIDPIESIDDWNYKIIYELPKFIETEYAMLIHADGYVINPQSWLEEFLDYDYVGAPWPLPQDSYSYRSASGDLVRVGNSVSIRSKRLMDLASCIPEHDFWMIKDKFGNTNEDGFICCHQRNFLEKMGCKFAPLEVAVHFSKEHEIPENVGIDTFAFHQVDK